MVGYSKWVNIKYCKVVQDVKCGKIFMKIICELVIVVCLGGGDLVFNLCLCVVVDKVLFNNMICDILNCVIVCGVGGDEDVNMEIIIYEGYGSGGIVVMVECLFDNCNCIVVEVCYVFIKIGGNFGIDGFVFYLFSKKGVIFFEKGDEDIIMEVVLEVGVEDVVIYDDGVIDVYIVWEEMGVVCDVLEVVGLKVDVVEVLMILFIKVDMDVEMVLKLLCLIDMFEDCDDVQEVYYNGEIFDEVVVIL